MPQKLHSNAPSYLKSFLSVTNLTSHEYIFSRVKLTSCALIRSDWFSASMRRQMSLDPLSPRAERCVTERGARTGLGYIRLCNRGKRARVGFIRDFHTGKAGY